MPVGFQPSRWARFGSLSTVTQAALAVVILTVVTNAGADADLWGHVRFGQDILAAGGVVRTDPYSFTSDREWVNHEWLAEVAMAMAWTGWGSAGLVALKGCLLGAPLVLVAWVARRRTRAPLAWWLPVLVAAIGIVPRATTVRPQLFSLLLFAVQMVILDAHARQGRRWPLLLLPPLYALWVNLHGGWLVGGGVLALWAAGQSVSRRVPPPDRAFLVLAGAAALAATLVNPYGIGMWRFLVETVGLSRHDIADWQPVWTSAALLIPWAVVTATATVVLGMSGSRLPEPARLLVVAALWLLTLKVSRIDAFFALAVAVLLAGELTTWAARVLAQRAPPPLSYRDALGRSVITAVVMAALLAVGATLVRVNASCLAFGDPATAPEPEAVAFVRTNGLEGRMLTYYNYGQYAIWHLAPAIKVSMDGRRETVYSDRIVDAHWGFYNAPNANADLPDSIAADFVWLPRVFHVGPALADRGWTTVFDGPVSTIWARRPTDQMPTRPPPRASGRRCFPGP